MNNRLRNKLVDLKRNSNILTYIYYLTRKPIYLTKKIKVNYETKRRKKGYEDERYRELKKYKNKHSGERCFIIATGPSLCMNDIELIKNEYTFGMNSICKMFNNTDWRPTYYGIQDCYVYEKLEDTINNYYQDKDNIFVADRIFKKFQVSKTYIKFPLNVDYHENEMEINKYSAKFSDDCYSIIYDGYSITYSLIQLAVYMGFKEIYLLGTDCSYKKGKKNHYIESGFVDKNEEKNYDKMITGYIEAKKYADSHEINIYNCTRGGMLEVFERKKLEEVIGV